LARILRSIMHLQHRYVAARILSGQRIPQQGVLMPTGKPSDTEVRTYIQSLNNWGRWGRDDELGTLNFIDDQKRRESARLVRDGVAVSCARPIVNLPSVDSTSPPLHYMVGSGEAFGLNPDETPGALQSASDFIGMAFHGFTVTHLDALCHIFWNGKMYNDRSSQMVSNREGALVESIDTVKDGIVSKGILLDVARHRGVDWLELGEGIFPEELEDIQRECNVSVEPGDIVLVRTGHYLRRMQMGPVPTTEGWPGLEAACLPWLHQKRVSVLGGDTVSDVVPSGYAEFRQPIHQIGIVQMGLWLIDNCNLEELAKTCAELGRWEFQMVLAPLRIQYGTGSPINPIALF